jgi:hypothetical protein
VIDQNAGQYNCSRPTSEVGNATGLTDSSIVKDNIESSKLLDCLINHALDVCFFTYIAFNSNSFWSIFDNLIDELDSLVYSFRSNISADNMGSF